ncbi:uncharacterized protein LOC111776400 [Cucurbita pepo subsp. pepo]|uniref:uncharacterized protein LOC111776400 n=1 Tax=Cucurbita pepo subsp. pepo TaxID=3664 RepID=UPI000C9D55F2|nr:uncharacterized protein LOC111776400 [Cucurbita pepo subsp. pepo]
MDGSAESGWTVYLENSSSSSSSSFLFTPTIHDSFGVLHKDEHELDLSMVSDASSGPPIFPENYVIFPENEALFPENYVIFPENEAIFPENETGSKTSRKMKGCEERRRRRRDRMDKTTSFLDDTASSDPNFNNSESSSYQSQFNTIRQSSPSRNQRQKNQWFKGKR